MDRERIQIGDYSLLCEGPYGKGAFRNWRIDRTAEPKLKGIFYPQDHKFSCPNDIIKAIVESGAIDAEGEEDQIHEADTGTRTVDAIAYTLWGLIQSDPNLCATCKKRLAEYCEECVGWVH